MNEPQYVAQTLAWCNARRKEQGLKALKKLPKGARRSPASCPCGAATGLWVEGKCAFPGHMNFDFALLLPRSVRRFIRAFDDGHLPQYEAKR